MACSSCWSLKKPRAAGPCTKNALSAAEWPRQQPRNPCHATLQFSTHLRGSSGRGQASHDAEASRGSSRGRGRGRRGGLAPRRGSSHWRRRGLGGSSGSRLVGLADSTKAQAAADLAGGCISSRGSAACCSRQRAGRLLLLLLLRLLGRRRGAGGSGRGRHGRGCCCGGGRLRGRCLRRGRGCCCGGGRLRRGRSRLCPEHIGHGAGRGGCSSGGGAGVTGCLRVGGGGRRSRGRRRRQRRRLSCCGRAAERNLLLCWGACRGLLSGARGAIAATACSTCQGRREGEEHDWQR